MGFRFTLLSMSLNLKHMQVFERGEDEWNGRLERNGWSGDKDAKYSLERGACPHWWLSYSGGAKKIEHSRAKKIRKCTIAHLSSALTRLLLLFWQHDDLPHFLHEVAVIHLSFGSSVYFHRSQKIKSISNYPLFFPYSS